MMSLLKGCPGAINIREVVPEDIDCPQCGRQVEIWSDELTARCPRCGARVTRKQGPACIDWCSFAEQCIGPEKYERLKKTDPAEEDAS